MKVEVQLFGVQSSLFKEVPFGRPLSIELPEGSTVKDLMEKLDVSKEQSYSVVINDLYSDLNTLLRANDQLAIFPAMSGG